MTSPTKAAFTEGSVWSLQFARTKPGATAEYVNHMADNWKPIMEEAKKRGIILSYRILLSNLTAPDDWDVLLLIELKNMAALDGYRERIDSLIDAVGGGGGCNIFLDPASIYMRLVREVSFQR
jgi:hypothetical protein